MSNISLQLINKTKNTIIAHQVKIADSFFSRGLGLMFKKSFLKNNALWIKPGAHIHTFFMNFAIDLIFVDKNLKVIKTHSQAKPWKHFWLGSWKSRSVFELPEGTLSEMQVQVGDQLYVGH